jgi:hypothetical protein
MPSQDSFKFLMFSLTSQWVHKYKTFNQQYRKARHNAETPCSEDYTLLGCDTCSWTCCVHFWTLKVETAGTSKIMVNIYHTTRCHNPEGSNPYSCCCKNLTSPCDVCAEGLISGTFLTPGTAISLQTLACSCQQRTWTTRRLSTTSLTINYLMHDDSPTQCK